MSTWDDKPNDYEHALQMIERLRRDRDSLESTADSLKEEIRNLRDLYNKERAARFNAERVGTALQEQLVSAKAVLKEIEKLGAYCDGSPAIRMGNIAHAALISLADENS